MTIKQYSRNYLFKYFLYSLAGFVIAIIYSVIVIFHASQDFSTKDINVQIQRLEKEIGLKQQEIKEIKNKIEFRKQAKLNIEEEEKRLKEYLAKLNTIGINRGLFEVKFGSIKKDSKYINHANIVLEVKSPGRFLSDDLSAEIFKDTILKDEFFRSVFKPYKNNFEIIGNEIHYTSFKEVTK